MKITEENWTYTHFLNDQLMAQITLGASPAQGQQGPEIVYYVTVMQCPKDGNLEEPYQELFQFRHHSLNNAIDDINSRYQHWEYIDRTAESESSSESGCSSCAAH